MARGVNKVILIGNVGGDPEVRYMPNGNAVTTLSIATSETWKEKDTGAKQERTEWHRVVFFNKLGEIAGQYVRKGTKIYIEGSLRTRKWQDQQGQDRYTTEIVGSEMQMLDSKGQSSSYDDTSSTYQEPVMTTQPAQQPAPMYNAAPTPPASPSQYTQPATPMPFNGIEDDVPF